MQKITRSTLITLILSLLTLNLTGCQSSKVLKDLESNFLDIVENSKPLTMDHSINYETPLSTVDTVYIDLGIDVSNVNLHVASGNNILFSQKATYEEMLCKEIKSQKGSTLHLAYKSPKSQGVHLINKNGLIDLALPPGPLYILSGGINVGNVQLELDEILVESISFKIDVGTLEINAATKQEYLNTITASVNVGNIGLTMDDIPSITLIETEVNVGNTSILIKNRLKSPLILNALVKVGDLKFLLPNTQPAQLNCKLAEFTSSLSIMGLDYHHSKESYTFVGDGVSNAPITGKINLSIGIIEIKSSPST
jgi:hypothetical protein